ncbi:MAG: hypothetical protein BGO13_07885 [Burkholderiales bacterium 66-5]|uniref:methyltransferase family protein n=1 Tax=Comamonas badia TaxID=265291 RepID=UPI0004664BB0|nr:isoprenylcysteine carboxylmethyltransferase family protein [Comamonas badia]OJU89876.1 MAG: hypothetical protein BGO13_07885 [Burkholderiales bacterium 66-5]
MNLELKIPPPAVLAVTASSMWLLAKLGPLVSIPHGTAFGVLLMVGGLVLNIAGVITVRRAKTTFNPLKPESATALVSTGLFGLSRNPMYLAMLIGLLGFAICLSSPLALMGPAAFVLYMNRFQILPEERALSSLFGSGYDAYKARVRRWI